MRRDLDRRLRMLELRGPAMSGPTAASMLQEIEKARLAALLANASSLLQYSDHQTGHGRASSRRPVTLPFGAWRAASKTYVAGSMVTEMRDARQTKRRQIRAIDLSTTHCAVLPPWTGSLTSAQKAGLQLAHPVVALQGKYVRNLGDTAFHTSDAAFGQDAREGRAHGSNGRTDRVVGADD